MRSMRKMWRNGPGGRWSTRIVWYDDAPTSGPSGKDIRLAMEDCERKINHFPGSIEEANWLWFTFRQGSPQDGDKVPFLADLMDLLKKWKEKEQK